MRFFKQKTPLHVSPDLKYAITGPNTRSGESWGVGTSPDEAIKFFLEHDGVLETAKSNWGYVPPQPMHEACSALLKSPISNEWLSCDVLGGHDTHENIATGVTWRRRNDPPLRSVPS